MGTSHGDSLLHYTMVSIQLDPDHGYLVLVVAGTWLLNIWQMSKVGGARKRLGVPYPDMYSDKQPLFNCYQRAHQNTLENIPLFLAILLISGLNFPKLAAGAGLVWLIGRVIYSYGYYTGEPKNRLYGFFISKPVAELPLMTMTVITAGNILGWW